VIGLDMTPRMIEVCRKNLAAAGVTNGEVRQGEMEKMPVDDNEVDWIISNCVINLSPEKVRVFAEAFRVLKPGGGMMISDIVTIDLPEEYRDDIIAWVGCIAGAVEESDYIRLVREAGFVDVEIIDRIVYTSEALTTLVGEGCCGGESAPPPDQSRVDKYAGHVASVKLRARKPA
jgi:SAM-dependent methyltransferase